MGMAVSGGLDDGCRLPFGGIYAVAREGMRRGVKLTTIKTKILT